nr:RNA demethylase ALKBH10B [Ipomoea batatas]
MPPAAGAVAQSNRVPLVPNVMASVVQPPPAMVSDSFAKDAVIAWFRGEFAAANAIIDALCNHLTQLEGGGGGSEYESVFAAIHHRRLNWIPILQMQKYYSIADSAAVMNVKISHASREEPVENSENGGGEVVYEDSIRDDSHGSPESEITDSGSQDVQPISEHFEFCSSHENCEARRSQFKMTKGFMGREPVKGHMVNVVRGLKLYEDIFTPIELSKLSDFVNELRVAGQNGELSGETFILYNQQIKGNKRELIQLGTPIFGNVKEDLACQKSSNEPIPAILEVVIDHLIQWHLISENRRPNGCIINFFDEGEYSQPFLKPPHLEQPVSTLLLSESTMAFGRTLACDSDGNYRGSLILSLKEGSLLVMRGNSADMARHAMCSSPNTRSHDTMATWIPSPYAPPPNGTPDYRTMDIIPRTVIRPPVVMLAPVHPVVLTPRKIPRGGTGVFLPWTVRSRKHVKHLPPRAQKRRFLALPSPDETHEAADTTSETSAVDLVAKDP